MAATAPELVRPSVDAREGMGLDRTGYADRTAKPAPTATVPRPAFEEAYEQLFDFVWRSMRRLGVAPASVDDAVQDVFMVVHRKLHEFEGRSSLKTWVYGIALRVARDYERSVRRKGGHHALNEDLPDRSPGPAEALAKAEAVRVLDTILAKLDVDKRTVFVLAEVEEMTAPEIAEALGINVNTVYSRLRAARIGFDAAVGALSGSAS